MELGLTAEEAAPAARLGALPEPRGDGNARPWLTAAAACPTMPAMAVRQHLATELGREMESLTADDGQRLAQILWRLSIQAKRIPHDIETAVAYNHALALAGRAAEARVEALRVLELVRREGSAATPMMLLNAAGATSDAGLPAHAMWCVESTLSREVSPDLAESLLAHAAALAVRYGELDWFARHIPLLPALQVVTPLKLLYGQGFAAWWPAQQRAVERVLGEHVASVVLAVEDFKDGTSRVSLDYFTDLQSHRAIDALQDAVVDALSEVYAEHPDGPGAFLGTVLIDVHGPQVPVEALTP